MNFKVKLAQAWYHKKKWLYLLWPFAKCYRFLVVIRRYLYQKNFFRQIRFKVPIIIVGNLTVGGTGKTPMVIWLANQLKHHGYKPAIITRGYKSHNKFFPYTVQPQDDALKVGDEALILAKNSNCPVIVDPQRPRGVNYIIKNYNVDVILADDGLQHYALARDIEICLVDGEKIFGNNYCLPAGPLREPISRLKKVDFILMKSLHNLKNNYKLPQFIQSENLFSFLYQPKQFHNTQKPQQTQSLDYFKNTEITVMTGLGQPDHFLNTLQQLAIIGDVKLFPDHHVFKSSDFQGLENKIIVMTEKDAIKCHHIAPENCWYLTIVVAIVDDFFRRVLQKLLI